MPSSLGGSRDRLKATLINAFRIFVSNFCLLNLKLSENPRARDSRGGAFWSGLGRKQTEGVQRVAQGEI